MTRSSLAAAILAATLALTFDGATANAGNSDWAPGHQVQQDRAAIAQIIILGLAAALQAQNPQRFGQPTSQFYPQAWPAPNYPPASPYAHPSYIAPLYSQPPTTQAPTSYTYAKQPACVTIGHARDGSVLLRCRR